jgi:hypothetical protein
MIAKLTNKPGMKKPAATHSSRPAVVALQKPDQAGCIMHVCSTAWFTANPSSAMF